MRVLREIADGVILALIAILILIAIAHVITKEWGFANDALLWAVVLLIFQGRR